MAVSHNDSWESIESELQRGEVGSMVHTKATASLNIKIALSNAKYSHRMVIATWVLAFFTFMLCVFSYFAFDGSNKQAAAMKNLAIATQQQTAATKELVRAVSLIPVKLKAVIFNDASRQTKDPRRRP